MNKLIEQTKLCPEAFDKLYEQNYSDTLNYCLHCIGNAELSRYMTDETLFESILANAKSLR